MKKPNTIMVPIIACEVDRVATKSNWLERLSCFIFNIPNSAPEELFNYKIVTQSARWDFMPNEIYLIGGIEVIVESTKDAVAILRSIKPSTIHVEFEEAKYYEMLYLYSAAPYLYE